MKKTFAIIMAHVVPFGTYAQPRLYLQAFDKTGETPLHRAARIGDIQAITFLITIAPKWLHKESKNGMSALFVAIMNGQAAAAELLIARGASTGCLYENSFWATPFHLMIAASKEMALKTILEKYPTYFPMSANRGDRDGRTPIMIAALLEKKEMVLNLLDIEVDIYVFDAKKRNALFYAFQGGNQVIIEQLIKVWNTDFDLYDRTPLHYAVLYSLMNEDNTILPFAIQAALHNNIDIHAQDTYGKTALEIAESGKNAYAVRILRQAAHNEIQPSRRSHQRTPSMLTQLNARRLISLITSFLPKSK